MVGFDPHKADYLENVDHVIAGAGSGLAARALLQPLDVLKIRFQLQVEPINGVRPPSSSSSSVPPAASPLTTTNNTAAARPLSSSSSLPPPPAIQRGQAKYTSLLQATRVILREEGLTAFWKGHVPAQYLSVLFGVAQFWTFEYTTQRLWHSSTGLMQSSPALGNLLCGSVSGIVATTACHPFDVIRTRLVAQSHSNRLYMSTRHAWHEVTRKEGYRGLYRGLVPSLIQITPYAGLNFGFYHLSQRAYDSLVLEINHALGEERPHFSVYPSMVQSFLCGGLAGLTAKTLIYPLDVIKKRLQVQGKEFREARVGFGRFRTYHSFRDCIRKTALDEGAAGFFKGLQPSMLKAALTSACHFAFYEKFIQLLALRRRTRKHEKRGGGGQVATDRWTPASDSEDKGKKAT